VLARDLACAALGWIVAAAMWLGASRLQRSLLSDEFGADGLPRGLALVLAAVSTLIAVRALWQYRRRAPSHGIHEVEPAAGSHAKALGIVAIGFGYVLLAPWLGYVAAAFLLIAATTIYYGARPEPALLAISFGGAVVLWSVFAKVLSVSMPAGFWSRLLG
jgi:putative tricarboxylic transport membrane protein